MFVVAPISAHADCWTVNNAVPAVNFPAQTISSGGQDANVPGAGVSSTATNQYTSYIMWQKDQNLDCNDKSGITAKLAIPSTMKKTDVTYRAGDDEYAVWDIGVPGIGIAFSARINGGAGKFVPVSSESQEIGTVKEGGSMLYEFMATLVFTGRLKSGTYSFQVYPISEHWQKSTGKRLTYLVLKAAGTITVKAGSCKLTNGVKQTVPLPKVTSHSFGGVGSTSAVASSPFSLQLQCDTGVKVHATMTDASQPGNTTDILSLSKNSGAEGVGIQVYREKDSTPVSYGPDASENGNTNQWYVGTAGKDGAVGLSFIARYIKTAPTVKPGSIEAQSTITFSYQ